MARDKLSPYWIRLRPTKKSGGTVTVEPSDFFDLTDLANANRGFQSYTTFPHYLYTKLEELHNQGYKNPKTGKTLTVRQCALAQPGEAGTTDTGYTIEAELGYGRYGSASDHIETEELGTGSVPPHDLREDDARGVTTAGADRLYLFFHLSGEAKQRGIILFHKQGRIGAKSTLYPFLNEPLQQSYSADGTDNDKGLTFDMNTVTTQDLVDQLVEDNMIGFEIVQRNVSSEGYKQDGELLGQTHDARVAHRITRDELYLNRDGIENLLSKIQAGDYPYAEIFEGVGDSDTVDQVSAVVKENEDASPRLRRLTRSKLTTEEYIGQDVTYGDDGRPGLKSISKVARDIANRELDQYGCLELHPEECLLPDV